MGFAEERLGGIPLRTADIDGEEPRCDTYWVHAAVIEDLRPEL